MKNISQGDKMKKAISLTLLFVLLNSTFFPTISFALTGVQQAESSSFEPVDATDMVQLLTGDFTYNIPIVDVPGPSGGYPLSMFYHAGITSEQNASWTGLGWNINPGSISRFTNGVPDDWKEKKSDVVTWLAGETETYWSVNIGVNFAWGSAGFSVDKSSSKGFGGSVNGSVGIANTPVSVGGSIGRRGVSVGVGLSAGKETGAAGNPGKTGGSLGLSMGIGEQGSFGSISVGTGTVNGDGLGGSASVGISLSSSGVGGFASSVGQTMVLSTNPLTNKDISTSSSGQTYYLPIPYVEISFTYKKNTWWLHERIKKTQYGSLYMKNFIDAKRIRETAGSSQNYEVTANMVGDSYTNPHSSSSHQSELREEAYNSLSFPSYDFFSVKGQGVGGIMSPKFYELTPLAHQGGTHSVFVNGDRQLYTASRIGANTSFSKEQEQIHFDFNYDPSGYASVGPATISNLNSKSSFSYTSAPFDYTNSNGLSFYNTNTKRVGHGSFIEYFTNEEISVPNSSTYNDAVSRGFLESKSQKGNRANPKLYDADGIGAFSVTTADGKTYHYSIPVYQFEEYKFFVNPKNPTGEYIEERNLNKYAYDWLLTAVTGPDYVDRAPLGEIGDEDYGYHVEFNYGKWTDAYAWRTPYKDHSYLVPEGNDKSTSFCTFGRKQIYYLNNIKTKTHTAYFVKSLREDGLSARVNYYQDVLHVKNYKIWHHVDEEDKDFTCQGLINSPSGLYFKKVGEKERFVFNDRVSQLKLDKIILMNNADVGSFPALDGNNNGVSGNNFKTKTSNGYCFLIKNTNIDYNAAGAFLGSPCTYYEHYEDGIISHFQENVLDYKDLQNDIASIEQKALKVTEFNYDYSLCGNTPNSDAPGKNKLTLNSVKTFGNGKADVMPATSFAYAGQVRSGRTGTPYSTVYKDYWGNFSYTKHDNSIKTGTWIWSLNQITTPMGAKIKIEYESDTYLRQAALGITASSDKYGGGVRVKSLVLDDAAGNKYKTTYNYNNPVTKKSSGVTTYTPSIEDIYIPFKQEIPGPSVMYEYVTVEDRGIIDESYLKTRYKHDVLQNSGTSSHGSTTSTFSMGDKFNVRDLPTPYPKHYTGGDQWYHVTSRTGVISDNLAAVGRILEVSTLNKANQVQHKTTYQYYSPDNEEDYKNGISQETFLDFKFYKLYDKSRQDLKDEKKIRRKERNAERWQNFIDKVSTPKPLKTYIADAGISVANATLAAAVAVQNAFIAFQNALNSIRNKIGCLIFCYNEDLKDTQYAINYVRHSGMLSVSNTNLNNYYIDPNLLDDVKLATSSLQVAGIFGPKYDRSSSTSYFITSSSRKRFPNLLKSITTESNGISQIQEMNKYDFYSGKALEIDYIESDGMKYRYRSTPAYSKYNGIVGDAVSGNDMGSKVYDKTNKNMLTQESEGQWYFLSPYSQEFLLSSNVQTWNKDWKYRDYNDASSAYIDADETAVPASEKVWRKHKSFVWKSDLLPYHGVVSGYQNFDYSSESGGNTHWLKTAETTRYNHLSQAIEAKDVNNNYLSNKINGNGLNIIASSGAATYRSFTHCSFEDLVNAKYFEGEVAKSSWLQMPKGELGIESHTGANYLQIYDYPLRAPLYSYKPDESSQKGKTYKASVWMHEDSPAASFLYILLDGSSAGNSLTIGKAAWHVSSKVKVEGWSLLTAELVVPDDFEPSGGGNNINELRVYVGHYYPYDQHSAPEPVFIDDFRLQTVDSPTKGFVYDKKTGLLTATLDNENFATKYEYDEMGRLKNVKKETLDGVKLVSKTEYHIAE